MKLNLTINLHEGMRFYGAYHHHPVNKAIHIIFVPLIWWSAIVMTCNTGPIVSVTADKLANFFGVPLPPIVSNNLILNIGFFLYTFYACYYLALGDLFAAVTFNGVMFVLLLSANAFYRYYGPQANIYAFLLHILSWYMQIHIGHMIFEGRKPALFDSLFQSIVLAPLFVWIEILFMFGYKKDFASRLEQDILSSIDSFKKST